MTNPLEDVRAALCREICGICGEGQANGECRLRDEERCRPIRYLPQVAKAIVSVKGDGAKAYFPAIREELCTTCPRLEAEGGCELRDRVPAAMVIATFLQVPSLTFSGRHKSSNPSLVIEALEHTIDAFQNEPCNQRG